MTFVMFDYQVGIVAFHVMGNYRDEKFVFVRSGALSLPVFQLQIAFAANGTEKMTRCVTVMSDLDSRILIEMVLAI